MRTIEAKAGDHGDAIRAKAFSNFENKLSDLDALSGLLLLSIEDMLEKPNEKGDDRDSYFLSQERVNETFYAILQLRSDIKAFRKEWLDAHNSAVKAARASSDRATQ